ncbi:MAG: SusC/RagA family TonB-linked outer membrane protein, partial [Segetibacter sp.]|nr:SusC/RagA family TonB-linked outer membrane protein [Segetibacter sp.]
GYPLPGTTGFSSVESNLAAVVQNTGVELEISSVNIERKNISWSTSFNISIPRNKLLSYPDLSNSVYANQYEVGKSLFIQRKYRLMQVDKTIGIYNFEDSDQDGIISNPQDLYSIGNRQQNYFGGLNNSVKWKNIELDIFVQFVNQTGINYLGYGLFIVPGTIRNQPDLVMNRWTSNSSNAEIQKFTSTFSSQAAEAYKYLRSSDAVLKNASFVRIKNISISYQLPNKWKNKMNLKNAKVYLSGQNLLTLTHYDGLDPENQGQIPPLKTLVAGIQLTF